MFTLLRTKDSGAHFVAGIPQSRNPMSQSSRHLPRRDFLVASAAAVITRNLGALVSKRSTPLVPGAMPPRFEKVRAVVFDVFGTVVDWRSSVIAEVNAFATRKQLKLDAGKFADAWRAGYAPSMNRVRTGQQPWTNLDHLHRAILATLFTEFGITNVSDSEAEELNRAWHRLRPWPDTVQGLTRLKAKFTIAPLSNGNIALMTDLAKHAGLPWDCVLGAELVRHYKPDKEVYDSAPYFLELQPDEVMMVAAHLPDLRAAKASGLRTGFVRRPSEFGSGDRKPDLEPDASVDVACNDLVELATVLGA